MFLRTTERNKFTSKIGKVKVPAERQKLNRQQKEKYLSSLFNTQTLKDLVQTPRYIKLSVKNQKQVALVGMKWFLLTFRCFVLLVKLL